MRGRAVHQMVLAVKSGRAGVIGLQTGGRVECGRRVRLTISQRVVVEMEATAMGAPGYFRGWDRGVQCGFLPAYCNAG
jgi:hypothetical protein